MASKLHEAIELGITEMKCVLGDVPRSTCRAYLQETKGDVALALNRYLDRGGTACEAPPVTPATAVSPPSSVAAYFDMAARAVNMRAAPVVPGELPPTSSAWPRSLGTFDAAGVCLAKLRADDLREGQRLLIKRAQPAEKATVKGKRAGGHAVGRGSGRAGSPFPASSAKVNTVVRLCKEDATEVGRLGAELADCVAPLLDEGKLAVQVWCSYAVSGRGFRVGDLLPIRIALSVSACAFSSAAAAMVISDAVAGSTAATARRFAFARLVQRLGMRSIIPALTVAETSRASADSAPVSGAASARGAVGGMAVSAATGADDVGAVGSAAGRSAAGGAGDGRGLLGDSNPVGGNGPAAPSGPADGTAPVGAGAAAGAHDAGLLNELMSERCVGMRNFDVPQPRFLTCSLRPYQREALGWMMWRELSEVERQKIDGDAAGGGAASRLIHPAWAMYAFGDPEPTEGRCGPACCEHRAWAAGLSAATAAGGPSLPSGPSVFYVNPSSGAISLTEPSSDAAPRGGLLADEMGLGKTVEVLALILADLEGASPWADEAQTAGATADPAPGVQRMPDRVGGESGAAGRAAGAERAAGGAGGHGGAQGQRGGSLAEGICEWTAPDAADHLADGTCGGYCGVHVGAPPTTSNAEIGRLHALDELESSISPRVEPDTGATVVPSEAWVGAERHDGDDVAAEHGALHEAGSRVARPADAGAAAFAPAPIASLAKPDEALDRAKTDHAVRRSGRLGGGPVPQMLDGRTRLVAPAHTADPPEVRAPCAAPSSAALCAAAQNEQAAPSRSSRPRRASSAPINYAGADSSDAGETTEEDELSPQASSQASSSQQAVASCDDDLDEDFDDDLEPRPKRQRPRAQPLKSRARGRAGRAGRSTGRRSTGGSAGATGRVASSGSAPPEQPADVVNLCVEEQAGGDWPHERVSLGEAPPEPTHAFPLHASQSRVPGRTRRGCTLVVCPMSLLSQWDEQIQLHAGGVLSTMVYYGQGRGKTARALKVHDVVLTTYGTLASEHSVQLAIEAEELASASGGAKPKAPHAGALTSASAARRTPPPLFATRWRRVVLDEAHVIKGRTTNVARAACALTSERRWAVSGTPIQNHLDDLFALLHFLRLSPLGDYPYWSRAILTPLTDRRDAASMTAALAELRAALEPLMLRRTKATRDARGAPIVLLPPRVTNVEWLLFSNEERDFYDALRTQSKVRFDTFVAEGRVLNNYATVLHMLLQLRQACDHPYLVLARSGADADIGKIGARLLKRWEHEQAGRDGPVSASASANFLERTLRELGHGDVGPPPDEDSAAPAVSASECVVCLDQYDDPVLTACSHKFCRECIQGCLGASGRALCPICREMVERNDLVTVPGPRFTVNLQEHWRASSKIEALMKDLRQTLAAPLPPPAVSLHAPCADGRADEVVAKVVVVSQWTSMLNLVEQPLDAEGLQYERLDGKLSQQARSVALRRFASRDGPRILLLSLRAGGVGLNLVAAQTLYLLDPWWNPAVEEQAVNRIHRIGQRYPVRIKRFLMQGSVEERIIELQERKEALAKGALSMADGEHEMQKMGLEDLKLLFQ